MSSQGTLPPSVIHATWDGDDTMLSWCANIEEALAFCLDISNEFGSDIIRLFDGDKLIKAFFNGLEIAAR